jgi:hypothetical protein
VITREHYIEHDETVDPMTAEILEFWLLREREDEQ